MPANWWEAGDIFYRNKDQTSGRPFRRLGVTFSDEKRDIFLYYAPEPDYDVLGLDTMPLPSTSASVWAIDNLDIYPHFRLHERAEPLHPYEGIEGAETLGPLVWDFVFPPAAIDFAPWTPPVGTSARRRVDRRRVDALRGAALWERFFVQKLSSGFVPASTLSTKILAAFPPVADYACELLTAALTTGGPASVRKLVHVSLDSTVTVSDFFAVTPCTVSMLSEKVLAAAQAATAAAGSIASIGNFVGDMLRLKLVVSDEHRERQVSADRLLLSVQTVWCIAVFSHIVMPKGGTGASRALYHNLAQLHRLNVAVAYFEPQYLLQELGAFSAIVLGCRVNNRNSYDFSPKKLGDIYYALYENLFVKPLKLETKTFSNTGGLAAIFSQLKQDIPQKGTTAAAGDAAAHQPHYYHITEQMAVVAMQDDAMLRRIRAASSIYTSVPAGDVMSQDVTVELQRRIQGNRWLNQGAQPGWNCRLTYSHRLDLPMVGTQYDFPPPELVLTVRATVFFGTMPPQRGATAKAYYGGWAWLPVRAKNTRQLYIIDQTLHGIKSKELQLELMLQVPVQDGFEGLYFPFVVVDQPRLCRVLGEPFCLRLLKQCARTRTIYEESANIHPCSDITMYPYAFPPFGNQINNRNLHIYYEITNQQYCYADCKEDTQPDLVKHKKVAHKKLLSPIFDLREFNFTTRMLEHKEYKPVQLRTPTIAIAEWLHNLKDSVDGNSDAKLDYTIDFLQKTLKDSGEAFFRAMGRIFLYARWDCSDEDADMFSATMATLISDFVISAVTHPAEPEYEYTVNDASVQSFLKKYLEVKNNADTLVDFKNELQTLLKKVANESIQVDDISYILMLQELYWIVLEELHIEVAFSDIFFF
jgi:hypothetical protein